MRQRELSLTLFGGSTRVVCNHNLLDTHWGKSPGSHVLIGGDCAFSGETGVAGRRRVAGQRGSQRSTSLHTAWGSSRLGILPREAVFVLTLISQRRTE